jgi:hypothetical protein
MGHTLDETQAAYFRGNPEKLKEMFAKYIPFVAIQLGPDISESPIFTQLKTENEDLKLMNKITMLERRAERRVARIEGRIGSGNKKQKEHDAALIERAKTEIRQEVIDEMNLKIKMAVGILETRRITNPFELMGKSDEKKMMEILCSSGTHTLFLDLHMFSLFTPGVYNYMTVSLADPDSRLQPLRHLCLR